MAEPRPQLTLRWCPVCGRDDQVTYLRVELPHNDPSGRRCPGRVVTLTYALQAASDG